MNDYRLVEFTLRDILLAINPLGEDWSARFRSINELRVVVESIESLRGATVEPYGSFVSNLFTRWGDLDISIELQNGSYISSLGKKHKQNLLGDVLKALRKKVCAENDVKKVETADSALIHQSYLYSGGCRKIQFISNARVPILKFESSYNISCDISISNLSGQMKSKLLFWINEIDGRFRDLVLLVKEWAKAHNINDSKSGTLNSYSLSLLVVFHLQTLEPAILPPLREIYPGNVIDDLTGVRAVAEKRIEDICGVNINRLRSDRSRLINRSSLAELFISFLAKFSDICSRASTQGVNPYNGQLEDIDSNMRWLPKTYTLFVEDPFEQPANTARTVTSNQLKKVAEAIQATHGILVSPHRNQISLVSVLVGPQISQFVARTSVANSANMQSVARTPIRNHSSSGVRTHSHVQRTQTQSSLVQQQFQKPRTDKQQNGAMNGPVQSSTSQRWQQWRPRPKSGSDG